ncbi:hypothetical protein DMUE_5556 [Dictyocoela muelleri]|nr:hypothetical protein DMUE_5556 [Dictyocoela muelleri]
MRVRVLLLLQNYRFLKKCKTAIETFNAVYTSVTKELESEILLEVTSFDNLRDYARKIRNKRDNYIPGPEYDIPSFFHFTLNGSRFLLIDSSMNSESRYVIFNSSDFLSYIKNLKTLIIDGTFKSTPQQFYQLLVIHGYLFGRFIPFIFILF